MDMKRLKVAALVGMTLMGCNKEPSLVGNWTGQIKGMPTDVEFTQDGKMVATTSVGAMKGTLRGTYKVDGEKMTLTANEFKTEGVPAAFQQEADRIFKQFIGKPQTGTIKFNTEDEATVSTQDMPMELKRVKEGG